MKALNRIKYLMAEGFWIGEFTLCGRWDCEGDEWKQPDEYMMSLYFWRDGEKVQSRIWVSDSSWDDFDACCALFPARNPISKEQLLEVDKRLFGE